MKTLSKMMAVLVTASLCVVGTVSRGQASTVVGGPIVGTVGYYDYSPHGVRANGYETEYWCGDTASHITDTILEERLLTSNWTVNVPERTAFQEGAPGSWDDGFTCNPSNPVQGTFVNVLGDGITYNYVIYYVGFSSTTNINQIGAAFSVDGLNWKKYPTPVESYPNPACGCYGYAQPNAVVTGSAVTLYYEDNPASGGVSHREAISVDGVHFTEVAILSSAGLATPTPNWGSIAYDASDQKYYTLVGDGWRPTSTTGGVQERGDLGCTLYSTLDPVNGTWAELDTLDTSMTGDETNFLCGFLTDWNGNILPDMLPTVEIISSTSYPRPAYNASGSSLGNSGAFNNWQIAWNKYVPGDPWRVLQRVDYSGGHHEVTTGWWDSTVYHLENINLGKLAEAPTGDAAVALYSCKAGSVDYFVSHDTNCENQYKLGVEGYLYSTPASDRIALYRCASPNGHLVSTDPACEGQITEGLLGYSQS